MVLIVARRFLACVVITVVATNVEVCGPAEEVADVPTTADAVLFLRWSYLLLSKWLLSSSSSSLLELRQVELLLPLLSRVASEGGL